MEKICGCSFCYKTGSVECEIVDEKYIPVKAPPGWKIYHQKRYENTGLICPDCINKAVALAIARDLI